MSWNQTATYASLVVTPALTIGALAHVCAKRRATWPFLMSVVSLWVVAGWVLGHDSSGSSLMPNRIPEWRHILASFIGISPLALLPAAFAIVSVYGAVERRHIPVLVTVGSVLAFPIVFMTTLASSCYIAFDCP